MLTPGTQAPPFTLFNQDMQPVSLADFAGKTVLLAFFPAAFTGVCQAELCSFQGALQRLNAANCVVVGICADLPFANKAFAQANDLTFTIVSDPLLDTIRAYEVALPNFAGISGVTRSHRSTFVIDGQGVIQYANQTENPGLEPNYDEVFAAVESVG
jgi:glutaredoxin-dependent peroxiredoxin